MVGDGFSEFQMGLVTAACTLGAAVFAFCIRPRSGECEETALIILLWHNESKTLIQSWEHLQRERRVRVRDREFGKACSPSLEFDQRKTEDIFNNIHSLPTWRPYRRQKTAFIRRISSELEKGKIHRYADI